MRSTTKNGKSEMCQIMWDDPKWNTGLNYVGRREYIIYWPIWMKKVYQFGKAIVVVAHGCVVAV